LVKIIFPLLLKFVFGTKGGYKYLIFKYTMKGAMFFEGNYCHSYRQRCRKSLKNLEEKNPE